jgi:acyl carrier protein
MDLLNVMIGLSERLGIEVPEADYGRMATLDEAVRYIEEVMQRRGTMGQTTA